MHRLAFVSASTVALLVASLAAPDLRAETDPGLVACGQQSALYQSTGGVRVWAVRQGTLLRDNPLRPLTRDRLVVLEVVVNGRLATAYGPDFDNLRQGGAPRDLEQDGGEPIRWRQADGMPEAIRVVAEDGTVLLGPMRFSECAEAPQGRAVAPRRPDARIDPRSAGDRKAGAPTRDPSRLPQGALDGFSLPKGKPE